MQIDPWGFIFFRKLPVNYHGLVVFEFDNGEIKEISKFETYNKEIFLSRFKEVRAEVAEEEKHMIRRKKLKGEHTDGTESHDVS